MAADRLRGDTTFRTTQETARECYSAIFFGSLGHACMRVSCRGRRKGRPSWCGKPFLMSCLVASIVLPFKHATAEVQLPSCSEWKVFFMERFLPGNLHALGLRLVKSRRTEDSEDDCHHSNQCGATARPRAAWFWQVCINLFLLFWSRLCLPSRGNRNVKLCSACSCISVTCCGRLKERPSWCVAAKKCRSGSRAPNPSCCIGSDKI